MGRGGSGRVADCWGHTVGGAWLLCSFPGDAPSGGLGFTSPPQAGCHSEGPVLVLQCLPASLSSQPRRSWGVGGIPFGPGENAPIVGDVSHQLTSSLSTCRSVSLSFHYLLTPGDGDRVRSCPPPPHGNGKPVQLIGEWE